MNEFEKETLRVSLNAEGAELKALRQAYTQALKDVKIKIMGLKKRKATPGTAQSIQYQLGHAYALEDQLTEILKQLNDRVITDAGTYLEATYQHGFFGTAYALYGQGIPISMGVDQRAMGEAVRLKTAGLNFSERLYKENLEELKTRYLSTLARGLGSSWSYKQIAEQLSLDTGISLRRAYTIARTEGARVYATARQRGMETAKEKGADIVKEWSASLDLKTRPLHGKLDGQIREIEEPFEIDGMKAMRPLGFGVKAMDINCRCVALTRARWAVEAEKSGAVDRTKWDGERGQMVPFKPYDKWLEEYKKSSEIEPFEQKDLQNKPDNGIIQPESGWDNEPADGTLSNQETRKWYLEHVAMIDGQIDRAATIEDQARQAFELRNGYRSKARELMTDQPTRKSLDQERPNLTFEALIKSKMTRKGMTRDEAVRDIIQSATNTNSAVNRELGLEE